MLFQIEEALSDKCKILLVEDDKKPTKNLLAKKQQAFFNLFGITTASMMVNWWYTSYNHTEQSGEEIVAIAKRLSNLWHVVLKPDVSAELGISEANRQGLMAHLGYFNKNQWDPMKLADMDMIYSPSAAKRVQFVWDERVHGFFEEVVMMGRKRKNE